MTDSFDFTGSAGQTLAASIERPAGTPRATALFAHCFTCTKNSLAAVHVSRALAAQGIATLRFDFTGIGGSGGDFADSHFSANLADLAAAAEALTDAIAAPTLLVGHSLGGAAVIAAARTMASVTAVATIGAPFTVDHVLSHFAAGVRQAETDGQATIAIGGRPLVIDRAFVKGMQGHDQAAALAALDRALLVLHSPRDETVGIANAGKIFDAARHPKSFVSLDTADHLLSDEDDARYAAAIIAAWSARYRV